MFNGTTLLEITVPSTVTFIGISAFDFCTSLTKVIIINGATILGDQMFRKSVITDIAIPSTITFIGNNIF